MEKLPLSREVQDIRQMATMIASGLMADPHYNATTEATAEYSVTLAIMISNETAKRLENNG